MAYLEMSGFCYHCNRQAVFRKEKPNNTFHAIMTIFSCLLWSFIWIADSLVKSMKSPYCSLCGLPSSWKPRTSVISSQPIGQVSQQIYSNPATSPALAPNSVGSKIANGISYFFDAISGKKGTGQYYGAMLIVIVGVFILIGFWASHGGFTPETQRGNKLQNTVIAPNPSTSAMTGITQATPSPNFTVTEAQMRVNLKSLYAKEMQRLISHNPTDLPATFQVKLIQERPNAYFLVALSHQFNEYSRYNATEKDALTKFVENNRAALNYANVVKVGLGEITRGGKDAIAYLEIHK